MDATRPPDYSLTDTPDSPDHAPNTRSHLVNVSTWLSKGTYMRVAPKIISLNSYPKPTSLLFAPCIIFLPAPIKTWDHSKCPVTFAPFCQLTILLAFQQQQNTHRTGTNMVFLFIHRGTIPDPQQMPGTTGSTMLCVLYVKTFNKS
jgi:hypothetical protein